MTYWNGSAWQAEPPASPPRPKRGRRLLGAATEASLITLLIFGLIAGTTLAAKGGPGGRVTPGGSCSVSPDPTEISEIYTVSGAGLSPGRQIMVKVESSGGTQILFSSTDASGVMAPARGYASWAGAHAVSLIYNGRKPVLLTACSFAVT